MEAKPAIQATAPLETTRTRKLRLFGTPDAEVEQAEAADDGLGRSER